MTERSSSLSEGSRAFSLVPRGVQIVHGALVATVVAAVVALLESRDVQVSHASGWLVVWGLLSPVFMVLGMAGVVFAWLVHGRSAPGVLAILEGSRQLSAQLLLAAPVALLGSLMVASLVLPIFSSSWPLAARAILAALGSVLLLFALAIATDTGARSLSRSRLALPRPPWAALIAGLSLGVGAVALVTLGDETGLDHGLLRLGVLRREGLDLSPVGYGLLGLAAGYQCFPLLAASWRSPRWRHAVLLLAATPMMLLGVSERALADDTLSVQLERKTALTRLVLGRLRSLTDTDGDGYAALFGGGDCDDNDASTYPGAPEKFGNGVDEDCSGADDVPPVAATAPAPEVASPSAAAAPQRRPLNLVLITIDTLRHELGYTGYPRPVSPNLDRLAAKSTVFERAYSLASYTGKSLGPTLIGRYPSETHRGWRHFNKFPKQDVFIQERLQQAGFATVSVQAHHYFNVASGMGRGFDELDMSAAPQVQKIEGDRTVNADKATDAALKHLATLEKQDQPFYLWVHYMDPHADYVRHPGFDFGHKGRDLYDGEVAFTDSQIGRLLDALSASGKAGSTAVIVTSDHGEAFGEHDLYRHGFELWEELVRVPLIIHVPGAKPRRVRPRRSLIDLAPTMLELSGQSKAAIAKMQLSGQSLLSDVDAAPGADLPERTIHLDMPAGPYNSERLGLIEDGIKLVTSQMRVMGLFDLNTDPEEKHDLSEDKAMREAALARLRVFRQKLRLVEVKPP